MDTFIIRITSTTGEKVKRDDKDLAHYVFKISFCYLSENYNFFNKVIKFLVNDLIKSLLMSFYLNLVVGFSSVN